MTKPRLKSEIEPSPVRRRFAKGKLAKPDPDGKKMLSWRAEIATIHLVYELADHYSEKEGEFVSLAETMARAIHLLAERDLGQAAKSRSDTTQD